MKFTSRLSDHIASIYGALLGQENEIERVTALLKDVRRAKKRIWILGNGGSLAVAQHFAQDLLKMRGLRAQCVNDPSVLTAYANDHAFEYSSYAPLLVLRDQDDPVVIFSCSGRSRNYIEFVSQGIHPLIAIVGTEGGFLKEKADYCVHVRNQDYALCETAFSIVADLISYGLEEEKAYA